MLTVTDTLRIIPAPSFRRNQRLRRVLVDVVGEEWWKRKFATEADAQAEIDAVVDEYMLRKQDGRIYGDA